MSLALMADDIDSLGDEILLYENIANVLQTHGMSRTTFSILKGLGLLTSVSSIALESLNDDDTPVAIESLIDDVKTKLSKWSAKVVSFVTSTKDKFIDMFDSLMDKLKGSTNKAVSHFSENKDNAKKYVKAHPYKTIAVGLLAAAAALAVGAFVFKAFPMFSQAVKIPKFIQTVGTMISKIKYPFGKIAVAYSNGGTKMKVAIAAGGAAATMGTIGGLGWTKDKITEIYRDYSKTQINADTITKGSLEITKNIVKGTGTAVAKTVQGGASSFSQGYHFGTETKEPVRVLNGTVAMSFTAFSVIVASAMYAVWKLISGVVIGALKVTCVTIHALSNPKDSDDDDDGEFL